MNFMIKLAIVWVHDDSRFFSFGSQAPRLLKLALFLAEIAALTAPVRRVHEF